MFFLMLNLVCCVYLVPVSFRVVGWEMGGVGGGCCRLLQASECFMTHACVHAYRRPRSPRHKCTIVAGSLGDLRLCFCSSGSILLFPPPRATYGQTRKHILEKSYMFFSSEDVNGVCDCSSLLKRRQLFDGICSHVAELMSGAPIAFPPPMSLEAFQCVEHAYRFVCHSFKTA